MIDTQKYPRYYVVLVGGKGSDWAPVRNPGFVRGTSQPAWREPEHHMTLEDATRTLDGVHLPGGRGRVVEKHLGLAGGEKIVRRRTWSKP